MKARHFGSEENAQRHFALREGLETAFAPALACYGPVVLEAWIEGAALEPAEAEHRAEEAGALLGRMHARSLGPGQPAMIATRKWRDGIASDLELLGGDERLAREEILRLALRARERDPGSARAALIHLDFCAENMLVDDAGALRVVDNELVSINPAGLDLGRTFHRWPMSDAVWRRFLRSYRSAGGVSEPVGFWKIAAALTGARVFLERSPERLPPTLALLRRFARGECLDDPAP